jgi:hypothetical protein
MVYIVLISEQRSPRLASKGICAFIDLRVQFQASFPWASPMFLHPLSNPLFGLFTVTLNKQAAIRQQQGQPNQFIDVLSN